MCVGEFMHVLAITDTPFNIELSSFGITFLVSTTICSQILEKHFCAELLPQFYISFRFLCNFYEQLRKNQWIQEINSSRTYINSLKAKIHRKKYLFKYARICFVCLFFFQIVSPVNYLNYLIKFKVCLFVCLFACLCVCLF